MQHKAPTLPSARIAGALLLIATAVVAYATGGGSSLTRSEAETPIALAAGVAIRTSSPSATLAEVDPIERSSTQRNSRSPAVDNRLCPVRSAIGLPLERLEWRTLEADGTSDAAWHPVPFRDGEWRLPLDEPRLELREPMHLPRVVASGAAEVVLQPRAVLTLRGEDESPTGAVAADTFSLAPGSSGARWLRSPPTTVLVADPDASGGASVRFSFELAGGFQAEGEWWPTAGARDEWVLSEALGTPLASADLELLVRDDSARNDWRIELLLEPLDLPHGLELRLSNGRLRLTEKTDFAQPQSMGDGVYRIPDVPLGRHYQLYALVPDGTAIARSAFRFEGQFVALVPVPGARYHTQLVDSRTALGISNKPVRLDVKFGDDQCLDGWCVWNGYVEASTDTNGALEFTSLRQVRRIADAAWPPPVHGRALVSVAGYQPTWIELTAGATGPGFSSLGTVELLPLEPDLQVLDVGGTGAARGQARLYFGGPGNARLVSVHVEPDAAGALALFVEGEEDPETLRELRNSARLALAQTGAQWRWLRRDGEVWREVPSSPIECWVEARDQQRSDGRLLLRWGELEVDFGRVPHKGGRPVHLNAPADGLTLALRARVEATFPLTDGARIEL